MKECPVLGFSGTSMLCRSDTQTADKLLVEIANRQCCHGSLLAVKRIIDSTSAILMQRRFG